MARTEIFWPAIPWPNAPKPTAARLRPSASIHSASKSGQVLVRTHVHKNEAFPKICRGMSGVLTFVEMQWHPQMESGELLKAAEASGFDVMVYVRSKHQVPAKPDGPETRLGRTRVQYLAGGA